MKQRMKSFLPVVLCSSLFSANLLAAEAEMPNPCESSKELAGACYDMRARYFFWGGGGARLWKIGSKNFLVPMSPPDAPEYDTPPELSPPFDPNLGYFGDYRVCPLAEKIGDMDTVCIVSVKNLVAREF
jgi:hypothetical protein